MDTANWVRLTQTFIADSAYSSIVVGGFLPYASLLLDSIPNSPYPGAYYYFDSIVVVLADSFMINFADSLFCAGDTFNLPYKAIKDYAANNVFTAQLSDASGSFISPINIGSIASDTSGSIKCIIPLVTSTGTGYKVRLVSSNFKDTTNVYLSLKIGGGIIKPIAGNNGPICPNDTLKLSATSIPAGTNYTWTGPSGFTSSVQNPKIDVPLPVHSGDYIVTIKLHGCVASDTTTVLVANGNNSIAIRSNSPVCINDTLKLTGLATGNSLTYLWKGPNGFNSISKDTIISGITTPGEYIFSVTNGTCAVTDTEYVSIQPRPADLVAACSVPCAGTMLNFTATSSSSGVTYAWTGPIGFNATGANPQISSVFGVHNGNYYVTATLNGCSLKDTVVVAVQPLPDKPIANADLILCAGDTVHLAATSSTNGVNYSWVGPNSYMSNAQNPILNNSTTGMSGDYIVSADLNGCKMLDTTNVTIKPSPAAVTLNSNSPICAGATLQLNSTASSTGATYLWKGPNAFTANTQNGSLTNSAAGATGWYKMTVDLNGCEYVDSLYAIVHPIPAIPVINYPPLICAGENMQLGTNAVAGASYTWTGANGFNANVQNPVRNNIVTADAGQYQVTVTVNGCSSAPGTANISINPGPFVVIFSAPADSVCQGEPVSFVAIPNNSGNSPQYRWLVNGVQAGTGSTYSTTMLNKGDVVNCAMTENTKCSAPFVDESNDVSLEVLPWLAPSVTITANPGRALQYNEYVTFTALPVNGGVNPQYQWKRNGQNIVGATGNTWSANTLNDNDKITVELISSYKCPQPPTAGSNSITVKVAGTGVNGVEVVNNLALYPNPNNGQFVLQGYNVSKDKVQISIINAIGQMVYAEDKIFEMGEIRHKINAGNMAKGVYMLRINAAHGHNSLRFVVE